MRLTTAPERTPALATALRGMLALAVAMGIGRFAFTPLLPMMQEGVGLSIAQGGWLASANYLGYLLGALAAVVGRVGQRTAIRAGLLAIAFATLAMGWTGSFAAWIVLRALPGFASAWVLVNVSAWALDELGEAGRTDLGGVVYAGVGAGIVFAGLACLVLVHARFGYAQAWIALGIAAAVCTAALWKNTGGDAVPAGGARTSAARPAKIPEFWRLVFCQGAFGFGYIIPATFLPVMAKQVVLNPAGFGWAWPAFGAAAVASTLLASRLGASITPRMLWVFGNLVMAAGVLVPLAMPGLAGIAVAALCVGGTFMVNTMAGMQEARRAGGAGARVLMAAMTSAFAAGQVAGPLLVSAWANRGSGFEMALVAASLPLFLAAFLLFQRRDQ